MTLRYLSVCSGIEAASVAFHPYGWAPVAFSEIDKSASRVLADHYPDVQNWGDMTKFQEWPDAAVDVLCGGTPCQSFSVAGLRKGLADPRGNLMLTYLAIAERYRPKWILWENVPGVFSSTTDDIPDPRPPEIDLAGSDGPEDGFEVVVEDEHSGNETHALGCFLAGLSELGYGVSYRVLDAQHVRTRRFPLAVPQRRRRVFVVGHLGDWRRAAAVLFDRESLSGHPPPRRKAGQGFATSVAPSLTGSGRGVERAGEPRGQDPVVAICADIAPTLNAAFADKQGLEDQHINGGGACSLPPVSHCLNAGGMGRIDYESETFIPVTGGVFDVAHALRGEGFDASEDGTGRGTPLVPIAIQERAVSENPDAGPQGAGYSAEGCSYTLEARNKVQAVAFAQNQRGELRTSEISPQLTTGGGKPGERHPAVAFDLRGREGGAMPEGPHDTANIRAADGGSSRSYVAQPWAVRRLTPMECERLQGFPDGYTSLSGAKKPQADGPRYKQLGNSWPVNVADWLAERIAEVDTWA